MRTVKMGDSGQLILLVCSLSMPGCLSRDETFLRDRPLAGCVPLIVEEKTTRKDVLGLLGKPDLIADGTSVTIRADGTLGRFQQSLPEKRKRAEEILSQCWAIGPERKIQFDPDTWARIQPYSSISDRTIALGYWEISDSFRQFFLLPIPIVRSENVGNRNKLLVLIDKDTDVVKVVSYREEFKVR
jgi:hypothetical protein